MSRAPFFPQRTRYEDKTILPPHPAGCFFFLQPGRRTAILRGFPDSKTNRRLQAKKAKSTKKAARKNNTDLVELEKAGQIIKTLSSRQKGKLTKLLNSGKKEDLPTLPGIGEKTVAKIIKTRPLKSSAHLITVTGVGEKTFSAIVKSMK